METAPTRNKYFMAIVAGAIAIIMAIGLSALPAQAYADYAIGTPAKSVKAKCKKSKCKVKGAWRLTGSSNSYEKRIIKIHKRFGMKDTFTFKKSGKALEKTYGFKTKIPIKISKKSYSKYYGAKKTKYKWIPASKKTAYLVRSKKVIGKMKVKGNKLTIKVDGLRRTYKRM